MRSARRGSRYVRSQHSASTAKWKRNRKNVTPDFPRSPATRQQVQSMADLIPSEKAVTTKQFTELTLLYQFSNTMLSTIRLNKLTHLILTALTSGNAMLFGRAIL